MRTHIAVVALACSFLISAAARANSPAPPQTWDDWSLSTAPGAPGAVAADGLLEKPAGGAGFVTAAGDHFTVSGKRIRFWGVNITGADCFPSHEQAVATARRLARFGVNAVRFHHMDMKTAPAGIFTDAKQETLSPQQLERLDYFLAALKREGVYANLNLHVSRKWSAAHGWPGAEKLPNFDKIVDLFNPDLIQAQQRYARDLLTHTNPYTKTRYADEPAVAMVEITNEDSLFMWDARERLASLPEPYATQLRKLWNGWLRDRYGTRDALRAAWSKGTQPAGENLLNETDFARLGQKNSLWTVEQHDDAKMTARRDGPDAVLTVTRPDTTEWHLQFTQGRLPVKKGQFYTLRFRAGAEKPVTIHATLAQAHPPYTSYGTGQVELTPTPEEFVVGFVPSQDDDNARVTFIVGQGENTIRLSNVQLQPGGQRVLDANENPANGTVSTPSAASVDSEPRRDDWYAFLQDTEQRFFTQMRSFLKETLGVKPPVTGTIGFTPLSTQVQAQMDFVDAHGYFDHPHFPHRPWDPHDWTITDRALVDHPGPPLWNLAATRVRGKPFTVTEYNQPAPNEWAAETVPLVATLAALQDWDAVFLFDYSHARPDDVRIHSYFDIEGAPNKLPLVPFGSRLFLGGTGGTGGGVRPIAAERDLVPHRQEMLRTAGQRGEMWSFARDDLGLSPDAPLRERLALWFEPPATQFTSAGPDDRRATWTASGPGTGRFVFADDHAAVFVGFAAGTTPIDLGPLHIERLDTPFAALMLVPADPHDTLATSTRLLLAAVARTRNTGMRWSDKQKMLADWGKPPTQIEVVKAQLTLSAEGNLTVYPLTPDGSRDEGVKANGGRITIGQQSTVWYEIERR